MVTSNRGPRLMPWFRVYGGLLHNPKVQRLPDRLFKALINLWCLTSENGGMLPSPDDIAFKLRLSRTRVDQLLSHLRAARLIDVDEAGSRPHDWNELQFRSDSADP